MNLNAAPTSYGGPTTFRAADHEEFFKSCLTVKLARLHLTVANALLAHQSRPLTPAGMVAAIKPDENTFTGWSFWNVYTHIYHDLRIATNGFVWCRLGDSEWQALADAVGPKRNLGKVEEERLAKFIVNVNTPPHPCLPDLTCFPVGWAASNAGLALAKWRAPNGMSVALLLQEYLFLRDRYPNGTWHVRAPFESLTPVQVVSGRRVAGGMMAWDEVKA